MEYLGTKEKVRSYLEKTILFTSGLGYHTDFWQVTVVRTQALVGTPGPHMDKNRYMCWWLYSHTEVGTQLYEQRPTHKLVKPKIKAKGF